MPVETRRQIISVLANSPAGTKQSQLVLMVFVRHLGKCRTMVGRVLDQLVKQEVVSRNGDRVSLRES